MGNIEFLTSKQLARIRGLSHSYTKQLLRQGKIKGIKAGRDWLIPNTRTPIEKVKYFTAKQLAKKLEFSHSHIRNLLRQGEIKGVKVGRDWLITDLEQYAYRGKRSKVKGAIVGGDWIEETNNPLG